MVWSRKTYDGALIHIDGEGQRATHFSSEHENALQLWLMGGSTMWGQGAPDTETIPSFMARQLNADLGVDVQVRNLGEIGYVSTQEIVALIRQLQLGRRPDFVVFFDGVNDAPAAALWPETVGTHMNYYRIRDRFEAPGKRRNNVVQAVIGNSGMVRFSAYLAKKMGVSPDTFLGAWNAPESAEEVRERGETAARLWLDNFRLISALGKAYDFVPVAVLQPSLMVGEKPLHPAEKALQITEMENEAKRTGMEVYAEMLRSVRELLPQEELSANIHDLSDLFADSPTRSTSTTFTCPAAATGSSPRSSWKSSDPIFVRIFPRGSVNMCGPSCWVSAPDLTARRKNRPRAKTRGRFGKEMNAVDYLSSIIRLDWTVPPVSRRSR